MPNSKTITDQMKICLEFRFCCTKSFNLFGDIILQITDETSSLVVAQLLFLQSENGRTPVHMYINSPGTNDTEVTNP